jgi:NADPH:quinone reductase-like Zn-dependent oxidoreductase
VGDRVKGLKPGDRVYAFGLLNPKGGFYAEYAAVKADDVSRIPGKLTTQQAGAITSEEASMATILIDKNVMVPMRDGLRLATDVHRLDGATPSPVLKNCFRVSVSTGFFIAID